MKWLAVTLLSVGLLAAKENTLSLQDARDGWLLLFDGDSLMGWADEATPKWRVADGTLFFENAKSGLLRSTTPFADFVLKFDFRAADTDHAGDVFLRIPADGNPNDNGYLLRHGTGIVSVTKPESPPPASGAWHSVEVEADGDRFTVRLDGVKLAEGTDSRSKAGFIALGGKAGGRVEYRNVKLKPLNSRKLFNGTELAGWKTVTPAPPKPGAGASALKKILKISGASPKAKEANWSLVAGSIHGKNGPGQLETQAPFDDFLLQLDLRATGKAKKDQALTAVYVRGEPGQAFSGYEVIDGSLAGLKTARKSTAALGDFITETIAARDRHFEIWINGYPVTEFIDPRPDSTSPRKGARAQAGTIGLQAPSGDATSDFRNISLSAIPKTLGGDMTPKAAPPVQTQISANQPPAGAQFPAPGVSPQMQQQQLRDEAKQAKISRLTSESLQSADNPKRQMELNQEILTLDPTNMVALQVYNQAEAKIDATSAQEQKKSEERSTHAEQETKKQEQFSTAMSKGETAIIAGDLTAASRYLAMAERLAPGNPRVGSLRNRIDSTLNFRQRLRYVATGAGLIALLAAIGLWWRSRGKKLPYLEVVEGLDKGKRFDLNQEVSHIGAVAQDGGAKNEIVLRDVERMVSRFHCEIHNQNGKLFLMDCNSSNGTAVDGKRVAAGKAMRIKNGSKIQLGRTCALRLGFEKKKRR